MSVVKNIPAAAPVAAAPAAIAPPPPPPAPLRVGGEIKEPKRIHYVPPVYPPIARAAKVQGMVIIQATIDRDGNVKDLQILRHQPMLDQAALDAVSQWKYTPTMLGGQPVEVILTVTVNFTLR
jgi:protein TonB